MDNEELSNMLLACVEKLKDETFEVDVLTECHICKLADIILNGTSSVEQYNPPFDKMLTTRKF